jgi:hypothetical protein
LEGSRKGASLSAGALLGEPGEGGAPKLAIQKDMGKRAQGTGISLCGGSNGKPGRGLVYPGLVLKKALEMGTFLHTGGPHWESWGGPFTRNSER